MSEVLAQLEKKGSGGAKEPTGCSVYSTQTIAGGRSLASYNISAPEFLGFATLGLYEVIFGSEGNQIFTTRADIIGVLNGKFTGSTSVSGSAQTFTIYQFTYD